jgi:hypothetical protein
MENQISVDIISGEVYSDDEINSNYIIGYEITMQPKRQCSVNIAMYLKYPHCKVGDIYELQLNKICYYFKVYKIARGYHISETDTIVKVKEAGYHRNRLSENYKNINMDELINASVTKVQPDTELFKKIQHEMR